MWLSVLMAIATAGTLVQKEDPALKLFGQEHIERTQALLIDVAAAYGYPGQPNHPKPPGGIPRLTEIAEKRAAMVPEAFALFQWMHDEMKAGQIANR